MIGAGMTAMAPVGAHYDDGHAETVHEHRRRHPLQNATHVAGRRIAPRVLDPKAWTIDVWYGVVG